MSLPSPYFSIVLPTCNRVQFIKEAIESVLLQTFDNWELFVINDGSQDGTDKVISQYASDKVRIINLSDNYGVSYARNCALELASGKYIAFLDDDDLYESSFLQTSYDQIETDNDEYDFYWTGIGVFNDSDEVDKKIISKVVWSADSRIKNDAVLLLKKIALAHGVVIKTHSLKNVGFFDKNFINSEDKDLFLRMIEQSFNYKSIPKILVLKRNHSYLQLSHNSDSSVRVQSAEKIIKKHLDYLNDNPKLLQLLKRSLARKYYRASRASEGREVMKELFKQCWSLGILFKWLKLEMKYSSR